MRQWEEVESGKVLHHPLPGWRKELLPEEEVVREEGWRPPTPPRVDISLMDCIKAFKEGERVKLPKIEGIVTNREEVMKKELRDSDEVVLYSGACIVRTTRKGIEMSRKQREEEEREDERRFSGGRGGR